MLAHLAANDVVIISYTLLVNNIETIEPIEFGTLILDEAHAIKNHGTQRAKTVGRLKASFRLALTGTPVENHVGELWSLFNFLNPGLLPPIREFERKFLTPITINGDRNAKNRLKKILKPYLLRRRKEDVLDELPSKTEIVERIEPCAEESKAYRALKEVAIEQLESESTTDKRFQILAELTRLRLAACHPKLAGMTGFASSAKMNRLLELLVSLRESKHRVLVFSQFVKHLDLVVDALKQTDLTWCYLDGKTPPAERKRQVDSFQTGEFDAFLISLKAGGTGLNLTAANYVIHIDPWWNPAVEDQATDRSHRMGQTKPVTVYRLITKGTIEEKILDLHTKKRELSSDILSESESVGKLKSKDLLSLMK